MPSGALQAARRRRGAGRVLAAAPIPLPGRRNSMYGVSAVRWAAGMHPRLSSCRMCMGKTRGQAGQAPKGVRCSASAVTHALINDLWKRNQHARHPGLRCKDTRLPPAEPGSTSTAPPAPDTWGMLGEYGPIKLAPPAPPTSPSAAGRAVSAAPAGPVVELGVHGKPAGEKVCQVGMGAPGRGEPGCAPLPTAAGGLGGAPGGLVWHGARCTKLWIAREPQTLPRPLVLPPRRSAGSSCRPWASRATTW